MFVYIVEQRSVLYGLSLHIIFQNVRNASIEPTLYIISGSSAIN